jgi:hypothetical protein
MRITFRDFGFKSTDQLNEIKKQSKSNNKNVQRMNVIKSLQLDMYKSAKLSPKFEKYYLVDELVILSRN